MPIQKLSIKFILASMLCIHLAGCSAMTSLPSALTADIGSISKKAMAIQIGAHKSDIVKVLGEPQRTFNDETSGRELLYYCLFGMVNDENIGFWLHNDQYFAKFSGFSNEYKFGEWENAVRSEITGVLTGIYNCYDGVSIDWSNAPYKEEVYLIDGLRITTGKDKVSDCAKGSLTTILLQGKINEDSSFALGRLLETVEECYDSKGMIIKGPTVVLDSLGGYLKDGYLMGRTFREKATSVIIKDNTMCASSCAVAFLGGRNRIMETDAQILFHAPYTNISSSYERGAIDCTSSKEDLNALKAYYVEMVGEEDGGRLYERTMWYCSNEAGWVVTGPSAARLYGITTE